MSDSSLTTTPVYPTAQAAEGNGGPPMAQIPPPGPTTVEIDGKTYAESDLREALRGQMRQDDYTRKTQAAAEERRQLAVERAALEAERARARGVSRETPNYLDQIEEEHPQLGKAFRHLTEKVDKISQYDEAEAREREVQRAAAQREADLEATLSTMSGQNRPFFSKPEMREFMVSNGLSPNQAYIAYQALYGHRIAAKLAEQEAVARGATVPAPMGAGASRVSPPFIGAGDAPGIDMSNVSWEQAKKNAINDPEIR